MEICNTLELIVSFQGGSLSYGYNITLVSILKDYILIHGL
jgi:hypothetical protein